MRVDSIFGGPPGGEEGRGGVGRRGGSRAVEAAPEAATWIAVRMTDNSGDPVKSLRYEVKLPNGDVRRARSTTNGLARIESPTSGECTVSFPDLDASDWDAGAAVAATAATTTPPGRREARVLRRSPGAVRGPSPSGRSRSSARGRRSSVADARRRPLVQRVSRRVLVQRRPGRVPLRRSARGRLHDRSAGSRRRAGAQ